MDRLTLALIGVAALAMVPFVVLWMAPRAIAAILTRQSLNDSSDELADTDRFGSTPDKLRRGGGL